MNGDYGIVLAFVTGMSGLFHCLGMCGGVNGGFFAGLGRSPLISQLMLFHSVRIGVYALLGVAGALTGQVLAQSGMVGKVQGWMTMLAGGVIVALGIRLAWRTGRSPEQAKQSIEVPLSSLQQQPGRWWLPALGGLFNGMVPCSLVFSVAVHAAATADPIRAGLLMLAFGAGTLPAMLALSHFGALLGHRVHGAFARLTGGGIVLLGGWTFYEGYLVYDVLSGLADW